jgi:hypothetical protein
MAATTDEFAQLLEDVSKAIEISEYEVWPITFNNKVELKAHLKSFLADDYILQTLIPSPDGDGYLAIVYKNVKSAG